MICAAVGMPASADAAAKVIRPAAHWHAHLAPAKPAAPGAEQARRLEVPRLVPHPRQLRKAKAAAARRLRRAGKPSVAPSKPGTASEERASRAFSPTPRAALFNGLNQPGLAANGGTPPDPTGAIGPSHYVEMVNSRVGVYDRTNLSLVTSAALADFVGAPGHYVFDPQIQWDPVANRWLYAADDDPDPLNVGDNYVAFGWSKTSDPSSLNATGWCQYRIHTFDQFDDYPKLGHDDGHIIIGTNVFDDSVGGSGNFLTSRIWRIDKPASGDTTCPASVPAVSFGSAAAKLRTADGDLAFTPVPANTFDGSTNGYVVAADFAGGGSANQIMAWHLSGTGPVTTLTQDGNIGVTAYTVPAPVPQPLPSLNTLDSSDTRLTQAVAHDDPDAAGAEAVWTQHTVAGGGGSVVRWYELVPSGCTTPNPCPAGAKRQEGTVSDSSHFVFNGAISPSSAGNDAVVEYNTGSASLTDGLVQIRAQSRAAGAPVGQMAGELVLGTSTAADQDFTCNDPVAIPPTPCRWGDYAGATPDPNNAGVVWGTNQLLGTPSSPVDNSARWTTRNFALSVGPDTFPPDTTITGGPSGLTGDPNPSFSFTSSEGNSTFECRLDAQAFASCTSPKAYAGVPDGRHTFAVRAIDSAGNPDLTPASRSFTVDTTAPQTKIVAGPKGTTSKTTAKFKFRSSEAHSTFKCKLDRKPFKPCRSPKTYRRLKPGKHAFKVRATDALGHTDRTPAKRRWTIKP